jgi:glycine cleavage system protein P-like pyridoxal-binding family
MKNEEIDAYISQLKKIISNLEKHQENKKQNTSTETSKNKTSRKLISRLQTIY